MFEGTCADVFRLQPEILCEGLYCSSQFFLSVSLFQMEPSSKIFDYLYLGTEWNASNWEELEANNCRFILNVTREIPNFFPQHIQYYNVR